MKLGTVAVDVGYGNTKFAYGMGAETVHRMFPSLAPPASANTLTANGGGFFKARDIVNVMVEGSHYEVGPDVSISTAYGNTGRTLSEDFVTTPEYAALLGGALHYTGATEITQLMLGLPVHTVQKYAAYLKERFCGRHDFGHGQVVVHNVVGLPQPLGSLVTFMRQSGSAYDSENSHLVIDVGYFTTDWVVARGFTMDDRRSGGVPGGAARIYQQIAAMISEQEGETVTSIERIDKALRESKPFLFYDKEIALQPLLEQGRAVCQTAVKEMQTRVGRTEDIRSIVLTGGGGSLYFPAIRAAFPRTRIEVLKSPCFGNVNGFYEIGASRQARAAA
ncbi:PRTRC system protein D [Cupriavidus basilensis]|uniref:PRTRC system protein D n=1 Tax=Cupriavidus basilensis TaxID=68895 RepID=UPI0020A6802B|nr:PRTRC system protein D [Cupriavidus basilensis]MCP3018248.1 PRTRC system protein D [Cupriavidus basilensis]